MAEIKEVCDLLVVFRDDTEMLFSNVSDVEYLAGADLLVLIVGDRRNYIKMDWILYYGDPDVWRGAKKKEDI